MAVAAGYKSYDQLGADLETVRVVYDFDADGGAVSSIDLLGVGKDTVIVDGWTSVKTACTSGGSATVIVGVKGGDTDAVLASTAVAALTQDATFPLDAAAHGLRLAATGEISLAIGTAALTAGKIEVCLVLAKYNA